MKNRFLYIYAAFILSIAILVIMAVLFFQQLDAMFKANRSVEETYTTLADIQQLNKAVIQFETATRGFLLMHDSMYLGSFAVQRSKINQIVSDINTRLEGQDKLRNKLAMLHSTIKLRLSFLYRLTDNAAANDSSGQKQLLIQSKLMMEKVQLEINDLEKGLTDMQSNRFRRKFLIERVTPDYLNVVFFFTCFLTVVSFFFLHRFLRQKLRYQKELEKKVEELKRTNEEVEQLAHVASHELQEPLRKMRTFSSRLLTKYPDVLDDEIKLILNRIEDSALTMQDLVSDVVTFTSLIDHNGNVSENDLGSILDSVIADLQPFIKEKEMTVNRQPMPVVSGYSEQLRLLFICLMENSLKFTRTGVRPEVTIQAKNLTVKEEIYVELAFKDNGIGFDNAFNEKIFALFQRLHSKQSCFPGKGIGLSIVKRIVVNHKGFVTAHGMPDNGAIFKIYLPVSHDV